MLNWISAMVSAVSVLVAIIGTPALVCHLIWGGALGQIEVAGISAALGWVGYDIVATYIEGV